MANYDNLKGAIQNVIADNGNQEITGNVLQSVLLSMIDNIGANATYSGVATPTTAPGTPEQLVFYIAGQPGTYANFGGAKLNNGELAVFSNPNGAWKTEKIALFRSYDAEKILALTTASSSDDIKAAFTPIGGSEVYFPKVGDYIVSQSIQIGVKPESIVTESTETVLAGKRIAFLANGINYAITIVFVIGGTYKISSVIKADIGSPDDAEDVEGSIFSQLKMLKNRSLARGFWITNIGGVQITITEDFKFKVRDTTSSAESSFVVYNDPISYKKYPKQAQPEEQLAIKGGVLAICYDVTNRKMIAVPYNEMDIISDYKNFVLITICNLTSKVVYYTGCVFQLFDKVYYPNSTDLSDVVGSFNNIPAKDGNVIERLLYIQNQTNRLLNKGIVYDADNTPVLSIDTSANTITYKKVLSARIYVLYGEPLNYNIKLPESEERTVPVSGTFVGIYAIVFKLSTKEILNVQYSDWATELSDFKDFLLLAVYNYGTGIVKWTNIPIAINGKIYRPATVDYSDVVPDVESRVKRYFSHGYWVSNYDNPQVVIDTDGYCTVEATNSPTTKGTFIVYNEPFVFEMYPKRDAERIQIAETGGIQCVFYQISTKSIKHISYTEIVSIKGSYKDYVLLVLYNWTSKIVYYTGCVFQLFDKVYYPANYGQGTPSVITKPSLSFNGKTYLSLGDSITAPSDSYASIIANNFDLVWHNFGVSGCHWTNYDGTKVDFSQNPIHSELSNQYFMNVIQNQVYRVLQKITSTSDIVPEIDSSTEFYTDYSYPVYGTNEINADDVYLVTIACGTNDCSNAKPIGDYTDVADVAYSDLDRKTMWSAIKWAVTVLRKYLPNANIVIFAPIQRADNSNLLDYVNAEIEASVRFACPCVNMFNEVGIMEAIEAEGHRYLEDGLHPNEKGKALMGGVLSSKLLSWYQL